VADFFNMPTLYPTLIYSRSEFATCRCFFRPFHVIHPASLCFFLPFTTYSPGTVMTLVLFSWFLLHRSYFRFHQSSGQRRLTPSARSFPLLSSVSGYRGAALSLREPGSAGVFCMCSLWVRRIEAEGGSFLSFPSRLASSLVRARVQVAAVQIGSLLWAQAFFSFSFSHPPSVVVCRLFSRQEFSFVGGAHFPGRTQLIWTVQSCTKFLRSLSTRDLLSRGSPFGLVVLGAPSYPASSLLPDPLSPLSFRMALKTPA